MIISLSGKRASKSEELRQLLLSTKMARFAIWHFVFSASELTFEIIMLSTFWNLL